MPEFEYFRPKSLEQALQLLQRAQPLGGGSELTPRRHQLQAVVDLQDLALGGHEQRGGRMALGGGLRLQSLLQDIPELPNALIQTCRLEAGWNLRNQATLAGCVVSGDGRSPMLAALLALQATLELEPGREQVALDEFLAGRARPWMDRLITWVEIAMQATLRYAGVARSPADRPILCAALARTAEAGWRVVLGGYGPAPMRAVAAEQTLNQASAADWHHSVEAAGEAAAMAYARAEDSWASAEYRQAVAGVLVRRLAGEIGPP